MKEFFTKVGNFFKDLFTKIVDGLNFVEVKAFDFLYEKLSVASFSETTEDIIFYSALAVVALLLILILVLIFKPKKRKYTFIIDKDKIVKKFKKKEAIPYPEVALADDEIMAGWFSDSGYNNLFDLTNAKKRKLKLYAKIVKADSMLTGAPIAEQATNVAAESLDKTVAANSAPAQPTQPVQPAQPAADGSAAQRFCPECGAKLSPDAAFCVNCGAKIGYRAAAVETPTYVQPAYEKQVEAGKPAEVEKTVLQVAERPAEPIIEPTVQPTLEKPVQQAPSNTYEAPSQAKSEPKFTFDFGGAVEEAPSVKPNIVEEQLEISRPALTLGEIYDEIRFELLSYERAKAFNKLGTARKKFIAEMFEKEGVVYLYLAVDPEVMLEKGYRVEKHSEPEFKVVPTKKAITGAKDYREVMALIKETMTFNNLVKSEVGMATKTVSDETARRNGFAFFVKNDVVATAAQDYYKLLRANVLSYSVDKSKPFNEANSGKMILKIFKKGEKIFVYLTLDAAAENLEFVGYDKNFADTPAMFEVATLDDLSRAYALIDKVMFRFGMEKHPENAELSLDESLKENCGFGYRIRN